MDNSSTQPQVWARGLLWKPWICVKSIMIFFPRNWSNLVKNLRNKKDAVYQHSSSMWSGTSECPSSANSLSLGRSGTSQPFPQLVTECFILLWGPEGCAQQCWVFLPTVEHREKSSLVVLPRYISSEFTV